MKMTPKQKAFFEYGKAIEKMNSSKKRLRGIWRSSENIIRRIGKASIIGPRHKKNIKAAWQKRAACRAWQVKERYCGNCQYSDYNEWDVPCCECSHVNIGESIDRWEPRKEEQDND